MRAFDSLTSAGQARRHRATARSAVAMLGTEVAAMRQSSIDTNFVFRVDTTDGRRLAVRVMRPFGVAEWITETETWFVDALATRGLPVGAPVSLPDGRRFAVIAPTESVPVAHRCVLWTWLDGSLVTRRRRGYWTQLGRLAGRLHATSAELTLPSHLAVRRWDCVNFFGEDPVTPERKAAALSPAMAAVVDEAVPLFDTQLSELYRRACEPPRLLHGDLHDGNLVARDARHGETEYAVFDFEDCFEGHPVHDLAVALYGPFYNDPDLSTLIDEMRAGYEPHAPWPLATDGAVADLRMLCAARALGMIEYCMLMGPELFEHIPTLVERVEEHLSGRYRY